MRQYYGSLLGSPTGYVRDFSAKCFTLLLRKLKNKAFRVHCKKILKAVAVNCKSVTVADYSAGEGTMNIPITSLVIDENLASADETSSSKSRSEGEAHSQQVSKRLQQLIDGVATLFFYTCKGVKGCLHSNGREKNWDPLRADAASFVRDTQ